MPNKTKIFFRADGSASIGLGHVIRSLALADMLKNDFDCHFIIRNPLPTLKTQILTVCQSIIELDDKEDYTTEADTLSDTLLHGDEIVVLDGYSFDTEYQKGIRKKGSKLACIDDIFSYHFVADLVINHAPGLTPKNYSAAPYTKFCLGVDYSLLRKPFLDAAQKTRHIEKIEKVFICFGGADFNNITLKVLKALDRPDWGIKQATVILGGANTFKDAIYDFTKNIKCLKVDLYENQTAAQMVALMEACSLAIVPASSILYEIASVKMPVISGYYVDNQLSVNKGFTNLGVIETVGNFNSFEHFEPVLKKVLSQNVQTFIDKQAKYFYGQSRKFLLKEFKKLELSLTINIRRATEADMQLYFDWANDKMTRANAVHQEQIPLENHQKWFAGKVKSEKAVLYVAELNGEPIGQVRFDLDHGNAIIDYAIDAHHRGKGLGSIMLKKCIHKVIQEYDSLDKVSGLVKISNTPSAKIFENIGFKMITRKTINNVEYLQYEVAVKSWCQEKTTMNVK